MLLACPISGECHVFTQSSAEPEPFKAAMCRLCSPGRAPHSPQVTSGARMQWGSVGHPNFSRSLHAMDGGCMDGALGSLSWWRAASLWQGGTGWCLRFLPAQAIIWWYELFREEKRKKKMKGKCNSKHWSKGRSERATLQSYRNLCFWRSGWKRPGNQPWPRIEKEGLEYREAFFPSCQVCFMSYWQLRCIWGCLFAASSCWKFRG